MPDAGFTVFELLIVLVVLAVAAAIILPRVAPRGAAAELRFAASRLAAALTTARSDALRSNRVVPVDIDLSQRTFRIGKDGRVQRISSGIAIRVGHRPGQPLTVNKASIRFRPDGSASGGWIGLSAGTRQASLTIDWMTGTTVVRGP